MKVNRRDMLKMSAGAIGGMVLVNTVPAMGNALPPEGNTDPSQRNTFYDALPIFPTGES